MNNNYYLLKAKIKGIKNIEKEIQLDFYNKGLTNFNPEMHRIKAIYGENGSGKTGIFTAINIVKKIALGKEYLLQKETQALLRELINKKTKELQVELKFNSYKKADVLNVYKYAITVSEVNDLYEITKESLDTIHKYTRNKRYKNVFEINNGKIKNLSVTENEYNLIENETLNLLSNSSFVSRFLFLKGIDITSDVFSDLLRTIEFWLKINVYLNDEDLHEMYMITHILRNEMVHKYNEKEIDSFIDRQMFYLDSKGRDIVDKKRFGEYKDKTKKLESFLKVFKEDLKSISIDKRDDGKQYRCELILNYDGYSVNKEFESTGIKKLIEIYDSLANADSGGISFVDEMDSNLNDVYLCKMIEYFMYYGHGQLCFTTHNIDPMTILKDNRNSIDFLTHGNKIVSWKVTGNASPDRYYKNGMIENSPFNIEASDFIGTFGGN